MTPLQQYRWQISERKIQADPYQEQVMGQLQQLFEHHIAPCSFWQGKWKLIKRMLRNESTFRPKGMYLWGGVGIGKTYLVDLFFTTLPLKRKLRLHFHRFMEFVHQQLTTLAGRKDPLKHLAKKIAKQAKIICLDEFYVDNITDAMLLGALLKAIFNQGVCVVMTSNVAPDDLYAKGLQRARFLPTIALLKQMTHVVHMPSQDDYRLLAAQPYSRLKLSELAIDGEEKMTMLFNKLANEQGMSNAILTIAQRPIQTLGLAKEVVWFDFNYICNVPRSKYDYLALAKRFRTVLISHVPQIRPHEHDKISYLISLVDIFYDEGVNLILSCPVDLDKIYVAGKKLLEFQRTQSRLIEMQADIRGVDNSTILAIAS